MRPDLLDRWKPAVSVRARLLAAAAMWSLVGSGLGIAGVAWSLASGWPWSLAWIVLGLGLGAAKARWVLARVAGRNADRIVAGGDGLCLGGFVSWASWILVGAMMGGGYALRHSGAPRPALAVAYTAVGVGLLLASAPLWRRRASCRNSSGSR